MKKHRSILKVSLLTIAFAICMAILSACNSSPLPSEHFDGTCIQKGFTRYYMPNGTYIDREDSEFGSHEFDEGTVITTRTCTQDGVTKFTCSICKTEKFETLAKFGHDYKAVLQVNPTCTEDGKADYLCDLCGYAYSETIAKLGHDYQESITKQPSCTETGSKHLKCKRCNYETDVTVEMLNHDYEETVIKQSTCTEKGSKHIRCKACGHEDTVEIDLLPHTADGELHRDDEGHWHVCTECTSIFGYTPHDLKSVIIPATCIKHAFEHIECTSCDYFRDVTDESSPFASHQYEAYTCKVCQRDNMLDYLTEFNSKGTDSRNLIQITSQNQLICFYDYLLAYHITSPKYIDIKSYTKVYVSNVNSFLADIRHKITATNWHYNTGYSYNQVTGEITYLYISAMDADKFVFSEAATITPRSGYYDASTYVQYDSYQFGKDTALRQDGYDGFAYKSRLYEMEVSSSDQLFFAMEHGYKPVAANGSPAQKMLDKSKAIARRIMDDTMSDLQKVRAIYSYLVSDVAYDYGIVGLTNDKTLAFSKCSSYYLEGVFDYGIAVCDGISKAFCVLAGLEDIKCVRITSNDHAWNKIYIDVNGDGQKEWFGTDATWGNQGLKYNENELGEYLSIEDFLFTDAQKISKGQTALNYTDTYSDATIAENPYERFYFGNEKSVECDYVIASDAELTSLILYLKENFSACQRGTKVTVEMFIVASYCGKNEISGNLSTSIRNNWSIVSAIAAFTVSESEIEYVNVSGYSVAIIIPVM